MTTSKFNFRASRSAIFFCAFSVFSLPSCAQQAPARVAAKPPVKVVNDVTHGVSALKRKNGEYLVLAEEDWYARLMFYRWKPTAQKPLAPAVTASAGNTVVTLKWTTAPSTGFFTVERAQKREGPFTTLTPATEDTGFQEVNLLNGTSYFYRVTAGGAAGQATSKVVEAVPSGKTSLRINVGGGAEGDWVGDMYFDGQYTDWSGGGVDVSAPNTAPMAIYQSSRTSNFTYTIPGQTAGQKYLVRLHFSEPNGGLIYDRHFDVEINGNRVLENFTVGREAGNKSGVAIVKDFPGITPNKKGEITLKFTDTARFGSLLNGLEIIPQK